MSDYQLDELASHRVRWLGGTGPHSDIVISSRIRLARNIAGFYFLNKCSGRQKTDLQDLAVAAINNTDLHQSYRYVPLDQASDLEKKLLVERQLISRQHSQGQGPRGAAIAGDEGVAIMVNEEDHLRMQVLYSGLNLTEAWQRINSLDDQLEQTLEYAFHDQFGYLTACPTNVGTGIRVSVMLHLPALKLTGEIERVLRAARDMNLAIRGLYGEGTEALGDFYQVSNQATLGKTEEELVEDFHETIVPKITEYESHARTILTEKKPGVLEDKVYRAIGMLKYARSMNTQEALFLLSQLRLGINMQLIDEVDIDTINDLFVHAQPAHLQLIMGETLEDDQRDIKRAEFIRNRMTNHRNN